MARIVDPTSFLRSALSSMGKTIYPEQESMIAPMFEALQKKGTIFVGQGPTGMGKTYVIATVTKGLREKRKRICIAVPSYTHLREVMGKHLKDLGVEYVVLRGRSALEAHEGCPLKNMNLPTSIFCSDATDAEIGPESKECSKIDCVVRREKAAVEEADVVLTVFHKLLSNPKYLDKFDVIIFDESHGLEPVVRSIRVTRLRLEELNNLSTFTPEHSNAFGPVISSMNRLKSLEGREIPSRFLERKIVDPLEDILREIEEKVRNIERAGGNCDPLVVNAFFKLRASIEAFKKRSKYRFIYHQGIVLGVPHKITFEPSYGRRHGKNAAIALISATIETPKFHAKDSGFPDHALAPPVQVMGGRFIERFRRRPIFGLIDGPILKKAPRRLDEYALARKEANEIIASLLPTFDYPVLILCRSHSDASMIRSHLVAMSSLRDRLFMFDDEESSAEIDDIETAVNNEIRSGKNIVLTSASSRLWEGVNLIGLRMLIVDALPYTSPQPYDMLERRAWGSWRTSRTFRFMIRRIQQGVGRLIRTEEDLWGIVVVVDGRFNAQWGTISSALPAYMTSPSITKFVTRARLRSSVQRAERRLERLQIPGSHVTTA